MQQLQLMCAFSRVKFSRIGINLENPRKKPHNHENMHNLYKSTLILPMAVFLGVQSMVLPNLRTIRPVFQEILF